MLANRLVSSRREASQPDRPRPAHSTRWRYRHGHAQKINLLLCGVELSENLIPALFGLAQRSSGILRAQGAAFFAMLLESPQLTQRIAGKSGKCNQAALSSPSGRISCDSRETRTAHMPNQRSCALGCFLSNWNLPGETLTSVFSVTLAVSHAEPEGTEQL